MMMPGRKYSATSSYRYGFNGKENDNEVKGEGNQQDYGMRIYDPRLGKFFSIDPFQKKYPSISPYGFCLNNPIIFLDQDGRDAIVSITQNKDGSGSIKVTTIVHVTGTTEPWRVNLYNSEAKKTYKNQTVNVEGKTWNIQYDIKYVYESKFDNSKLSAGQNVMDINTGTPMSGPKRTHVEPRNNNGTMAYGHRIDPKIIVHETGHFIGFYDQYTEVTTDTKGFRDYLKSKYTSKEDNAPGGTIYQLLKIGSDKGLSVSLANEGYENNEMQNNVGGLNEEQGEALVKATLALTNSKNGTYILQGYFDKKGSPKKEDLQKAYEALETKIKDVKNKQEKTN